MIRTTIHNATQLKPGDRLYAFGGDKVTEVKFEGSVVKIGLENHPYYERFNKVTDVTIMEVVEEEPSMVIRREEEPKQWIAWAQNGGTVSGLRLRTFEDAKQVAVDAKRNGRSGQEIYLLQAIHRVKVIDPPPPTVELEPL